MSKQSANASGRTSTAAEYCALPLADPERVAAALPETCRARCLRGKQPPESGGLCAWMTSVLHGAPNEDLLSAGACEQGLRAAAHVAQIDGQQVATVRLSGERVVVPNTIGAEATSLPAAEARLDELSTQLGELATENEGLVEEVLYNYEQLGLLFDVVNAITGMTTPESIERYVMGRLGMLFEVDALEVLLPDDTWRRYNVRGEVSFLAIPRPSHPTYVGQAQRLTAVAGMSVFKVGTRNVLATALAHVGGSRPMVVFIANTGDEFTASKLRACEALVTFASNLIANSRLHTELRRMSMDATSALVAAIDKKDRYTSGHSQRVGLFSRLTGETLGLPVSELTQLEWSGLLHDVGKIGVPEEILNKPGRLTDEEFDVIKKHPQMGYEILAPIQAFEDLLGGVLSHHENEDGTGYPQGLRGDEIPLFGRIIHVVDVFDAISSSRSYRDAFTVERSFGIIDEMSGEKLHAASVDAFKSAFAALMADVPREQRGLFKHLRYESGPDNQENAGDN